MGYNIFMIKKLKALSAFITSFALLVSLLPNLGLAQSVNPTSQPLVQQSDMVYLGKFTYPGDDGAGTSLGYGYKILGMGADGVSLYVGCIYGSTARITIPAVGGVAKVLDTCQKPANISDINPGDPNAKYMGGILAWQGKIITDAYAYYDGSATAAKSHWTGSSITNTSGPYTVGTMNPGFTAGNMGPLPQEWRSVLGGPAFTSQWALSIIGRSSSGPAFTVFDPAQLGVVNPVPATMLIGYPLSHTNPAIGSYGGNPQGPVYDMGTGQGGVAFPDGTRSILFIHRVGLTSCYGEGTSDQTLDRKPVPGTNGAVIYCYDLYDHGKGGHGYPYKLQVTAYDANDLLTVKSGTKNPWDMLPYSRWYLNEIDSSGSADIRSATYDTATKRVYVTRENGGGTPEVHVYQINIGANIIPPTQPSADIKVNNSDSAVSINSGLSANVTWTSTNASSCSVSPSNWTGTTGSQSTGALTANVAYLLTCTGSGGTATDSVTVNVTAPIVIRQEPVAYWKFDEGSGTTASDFYNSNPGTLINGPTWTTGISGGAINFDGVNDFVKIAHNSSLDLTGDTTISAWIKKDTNSGADVIVGKGNCYGTVCPYGMRSSGSGEINFDQNNGGSGQDTLSSNTTLSLGAWHHVAIVRSGSNRSIYLDGVLSAGPTAQSRLPSLSGDSFTIGTGDESFPTDAPFDGVIDEVRIYNRALSGSEISSLANTTTNTDTTKPTVTLTAPTTFTTVAGIPVFVSANATDNVGVAGVQFKVDGVNIGAEDMTSPYSVLWDTVGVTEGDHAITAVARDSAGNIQTSSSVVVTVTAPVVTDTTKPTVSITSPSSNSTVSGSVSVTASATDNVGVVGVQFKLDGTDLLSEDNSSPYSVTWNTDAVADGSHVLTAVARDAAGNTQTSSSVTVNVSNGGNDTTVVPPTVSISSPLNSSTVSNAVTISANAVDDLGVVGVQFKLDGVNLLPEDTTAPYSISWDTKTSANGSHMLTATARDVEGNQTTSSSVSVSVNNSAPTTGLKIGDKIKTTSTISVRSSAGGRYLGSQRTGKTGTITAGPGYANGLTWWKVNFTSGVDGWVAGNYIVKTTIAMTEDDYRNNIANIYLVIKYLQERLSAQN